MGSYTCAASTAAAAERRSKPRPSPFLRELVPASEQSLPVPRLREAAAPVPEGPLFDELREWRLRVSRETGVPAYVVFDNKTLAMIASAKPVTRAALLAIPGVGPSKLHRYAEDVLQIVKTA